MKGGGRYTLQGMDGDEGWRGIFFTRDVGCREIFFTRDVGCREIFFTVE